MVISLRIPDELADGIKLVALNDQRSINATICRILSERLQLNSGDPDVENLPTPRIPKVGHVQFKAGDHVKRPAFQRQDYPGKLIRTPEDAIKAAAAVVVDRDRPKHSAGCRCFICKPPKE